MFQKRWCVGKQVRRAVIAMSGMRAFTGRGRAVQEVAVLNWQKQGLVVKHKEAR